MAKPGVGKVAVHAKHLRERLTPRIRKTERFIGSWLPDWAIRPLS